MKNKLTHFFITFFLSLIFDRITKNFFKEFLEKNNGNFDVFNFFSFTLVKNYGIFFGFLSNEKIHFFLISFSIISIILIFFYILKLEKKEKYYLFSFGLIEGGITGNLIDRIKYGYVIDFINFHFWPVFNFADSFIVIGIILFFIKQLRS
ncbi:MAG: signal peptidase II [Candidatus Omnitrophica bacterium]|nr:signal peptidase II [Candidatus Omnitrophota bacterium]